MAEKTNIAWTEKTWNPVVGCSLVSPGCTNCYAMGDAHKISCQPGKAGEKYRNLTKIVNNLPIWNGNVRLVPGDVITQPKRWTKPSLIFVNSMSDLFHEDLTEKEIFTVLDAMYNAPQHIYQILTKRSKRMVDVGHAWLKEKNLDIFPENFWMGMSVEDQKRLEMRASDMKLLKAKIKWFSAEPLLGPLNIDPFLKEKIISWIVVGGESLPYNRRAQGEKAREFNIKWAEDILKDCLKNNTTFFFKQLGENPVGIERKTAKGDTLEEFPENLKIRDWPKEISWILPESIQPSLF